MIEQSLSAHPRISAGDELPIVGELTRLIPRMLSSPLGYPEALAELWLGDEVEGLNNLRGHYLQRARQLGALRKGPAGSQTRCRSTRRISASSAQFP